MLVALSFEESLVGQIDSLWFGNPQVRGYEIVKVIAEDCWYEAYDPNEARDGLKEQAISWGANAIVGLYLEKYSKSPYPLWARLIGIGPNYYQTMHRFYGAAVVIREL